MEKVRFKLSGDRAVLIEFEQVISPHINRAIRALDTRIHGSDIPGITETVPTYAALTVHYRPELITYGELKKKLELLSSDISDSAAVSAKVTVLPVLYGGDGGPDLQFVAEHAGLSVDDTVKLHSAPEYLIYMLGFTPGFTYLGGMDARLETPRLTAPRVKIPAGSVGIAAKQTGVYPIDSPGGWQLIGLTPVRMYDGGRPVPMLLDAGEYVKFKPIDASEFERIKALAEKGEYECATYMKEVSECQ